MTSMLQELLMLKIVKTPWTNLRSLEFLDGGSWWKIVPDPEPFSRTNLTQHCVKVLAGSLWDWSDFFWTWPPTNIFGNLAMWSFPMFPPFQSMSDLTFYQKVRNDPLLEPDLDGSATSSIGSGVKMWHPHFEKKNVSKWGSDSPIYCSWWLRHALKNIFVIGEKICPLLWLKLVKNAKQTISQAVPIISHDLPIIIPYIRG